MNNIKKLIATGFASSLLLSGAAFAEDSSPHFSFNIVINDCGCCDDNCYSGQDYCYDYSFDYCYSYDYVYYYDYSYSYVYEPCYSFYDDCGCCPESESSESIHIYVINNFGSSSSES